MKNSTNNRRSRARVDLRNALALFAAAGTLVCASTALATPLNWNNTSGGSAATAGNWNPSQVPVAADTLTFNLPNTFTVTFPASTAFSTSHTFKRGLVTLNISSPHSTSGAVRVGDVSGDSATMIITAGTLHAGTGVQVGNASGATGTLTVDDEGTLLDTTAAGSDIFVGVSGTGTMNITDGALVQPVDDVVIGSTVSGVGTVTVTGGGGLPLPAPSSTLNLVGAGQDLTVGSLGSGTLNVTTGGLVNCDELFVGLSPGSDGTVTVGGTGGFLNLPARLNVATSLHLGDNPAAGASGGTAFLTVNAGAEVNVTGTTRIGDSGGVGGGTLTINHGATFTTGALVATDSGGFISHFGGILEIDGGVCQVRNDVLTMNGSGVGVPQLRLNNGATCTLASTGSPIEALIVANTTNAVLSVNSGSRLTVTAGDVVVGNLAGSDGELGVTPNSEITLPNAGVLVLGDAGTGELFVQGADASMQSGPVNLGRTATGIGRVNVRNGTSRWDINGILAIGGTAAAAFGTGEVVIGDASLPGGRVNVISGGPSSISVRVWDTSDSLHIGRNGTLSCDGDIIVNGAFSLDRGTCIANELRLFNGGVVNMSGTLGGILLMPSGLTSVVLTGDLTINDSPNSSGGVRNFGTIEIGDHTLTLTSNALGSFRQLNNCHLGAAGVLNSVDSLDVSSTDTLSGDGTINAPIINSGQILSQGGGLTFTKVLSGIGAGISGTTITFGNGGGFTGSGAFSASTPILMQSGSVVTATGGLTLGSSVSTTGFSSTGGTIVVAGDVDVTINDSNGGFVPNVEFPVEATGTPSVTCDNGLGLIAGARVTGTGSIGGDVNSGFTIFGAIDPGSSNAPGIISLKGDTQLSASGRLEFDIFDATTHDTVAGTFVLVSSGFPPVVTTVNSNITLGGTLVLRVKSPHTPTNGERHRLVSTTSFGSTPGQIIGAFADTQTPHSWIIQVVNTGPLSGRGVFAVFCAADFNNDGLVSPDDLDEFITTFFSEPPDNAGADFNNDGIVSPDDLDEFITGFFEGC